MWTTEKNIVFIISWLNTSEDPEMENEQLSGASVYEKSELHDS
ncbi:unnamed protein product [Brassica rapa subsp. trilocularis]